jgi:hypothetical protein
MSGSPKELTRPNLSGPALMKQFDELHSQCFAIVMTLGTEQEARPLLRRLRQQAATLGRRLQKVGRANLKHSTSKTPTDPSVPDPITEEEFIDEVRKCVWDWLDKLHATETMDPHQRGIPEAATVLAEPALGAALASRAELLRIIALADG